MFQSQLAIPENREMKKNEILFFLSKMHCRQVLTFLQSPTEWLTFCQNWWTCYYFLWKKLNFHLLDSPVFGCCRMLESEGRERWHCIQVQESVAEPQTGRIQTPFIHVPLWAFWISGRHRCRIQKKSSKLKQTNCFAMRTSGTKCEPFVTHLSKHAALQGNSAS